MISTDQPSIDTNSLGRFLRAAQRKARITGEVNVFITSDAEMRRLNREFRGKNRPTDVLSFPASRDGKEPTAGDIAISARIAAANAKKLGHSREVEFKILLLHGLLHLAGHDHEADNGEMAQLEQKLRAELMLPAGLIARTEHHNQTKNLVVTTAPGRVFDRIRKRASVNGNAKQDPAGGVRIHVSKGSSSVPSVSSVVKKRAGSHS